MTVDGDVGERSLEPGGPVDLPRVTRWMQARGEIETPLVCTPISGGRSNLTYLIADAAGRRFVLRRPPERGVVSSAHDVAREARILVALEAEPVAVPPVVGVETGPGVIGAPFYVMRFVDGAIVRTEEDARTLLTPAARYAASDSIATTLADLHAIEPEEVGLGELGRREGYVERQLRRWRRQLEDPGSPVRETLIGVHDRLASCVPTQQESTLVHGDYRLDNLILEPFTGEVRAVLDWELTTLGDPRADLGLLLVYWTAPGEQLRPLVDAPTAVPGFRSREDLLSAYVARRSQELSDLDYFVAFGYWRLACILTGVTDRYRAGVYGEAKDPLFASLLDTVPELAGEADRRIRRLRVGASHPSAWSRHRTEEAP